MHGGIKLQLYIAKDLKESRITCLKTVCYLQYGDDDDGVDNADGDDQDYGDDDDVDDQVGGGFDHDDNHDNFCHLSANCLLSSSGLILSMIWLLS